MTSKWECKNIQQALGVYVLGAIDPAERSQVDRHISGCRECLNELAGLSGLPARLSEISFDDLRGILGDEASSLPDEGNPNADRPQLAG